MSADGMEFLELPLAGARLVRLQRHADARGFFARAFCVDEFAAAGLETNFPQHSFARSDRAGTLRGMHLQLEPHAEAKLVRCVRGRIFDAIVDLRAESPTYLQSYGMELDEADGDAIFVPVGFAHGYQVLVDDTDVFYAMSSRYAPAAARSIRWNDPALKIDWPLSDPTLSEQDRAAPDLETFLRDRSVAVAQRQLPVNPV
jgi:dTDP-4-dehydrorhamnose 3,5-epimerase